jgi:hypothetical protein
MSLAPIIALPIKGGINLRPELWLAVGVAGYNHALLAKKPLRILSPREIAAEELTAEKIAKLDAGMAALADASSMTPGMLIAALRITRSLLTPLGVEVTILGNERTQRYLLLEFKGDPAFMRKPTAADLTTSDLSIQEEAKIAEEADRATEIAHNFPRSTHPPQANDAGTAAHQKAVTEAETPETIPAASTGSRRTGGVD